VLLAADGDGGALGSTEGAAGVGVEGTAVTAGVEGSAVAPAPAVQPATRSATRATAALSIRPHTTIAAS